MSWANHAAVSNAGPFVLPGEFFAWIVAAYLLGSVPFGLVLGWWIAGVDIRKHGSGNIGATNLGRVVGWKYFPLALLLDFAKGALPVAGWFWRTGQWMASVTSPAAAVPDFLDPLPLSIHDGAALVGLAALIGHVWPVYLGFRGGKGVATGAGVACVLMPVPTLMAVLVWGIVAWVSRYVSLSSLVAALTLVVGQMWYTWPDCFTPTHRAASLLAIVGAILVFARHGENIVRLWQGRESKIGQKLNLPPSSAAHSETHPSNASLPSKVSDLGEPHS